MLVITYLLYFWMTSFICWAASSNAFVCKLRYYNYVIINLSFLSLVAIIYKNRKRYLCYKEDWMCHQELQFQNLVDISFTNNIWTQIKNTYLKI